jgi:hypothetical protein
LTSRISIAEKDGGRDSIKIRAARERLRPRARTAPECRSIGVLQKFMPLAVQYFQASGLIAAGKSARFEDHRRML